MTRFVANVGWALAEGEAFGRGRYSRAHEAAFDGGAIVPMSASPHVVGKWADPAAVDPEEMLLASIASCHMLSFLHEARLAGLVVLSYRDAAEAVMEAVAPGRFAVTRAVLRPEIVWQAVPPDGEASARLHHLAHEACFIANSVKVEITVAPRDVAASQSPDVEGGGEAG